MTFVTGKFPPGREPTAAIDNVSWLAMRRSNRCWGPDSLIGYAEGELTAAEVAVLREHVEQCEDCRVMVAELDDGLLTRPAMASPRPLGGGDRLGRYVLLRAVGRGGMGTVWAAYDPKLDRVVALKLLRAQDSSPQRRARLHARLRREAQVMAKLVHPNVVRVFDVGEHDGHPFVAMELIEGETFSQWAHGRSEHEIVRGAVGAAHGLAAAHAMGIVHRDVKPQNMLVDADGRVLVSDFGLARHGDSDPSPSPSPSPSPTGIRTDSVVGTPRYMAPEQTAGTVDARADQYAWCLVLAEALGAFAPVADTLDPERADLQLLSPRLRAVVRRGLAAQPSLRYPTMDALLAELNPVRTPVWKRTGAHVAAAGVLVGVGLAGVLGSEPGASGPVQASACTHPARFDAAFADAQAKRLAEAFTASGSEHAADTFELVASRLRDYQRRWTRARERACEGRDVEARLQCIDAAFHRASALVDVLADGSKPGVVERAVSAVARLPAPEACVDGPVPVMSPPDEREAVLAAQRRLDVARGLRATGRYREALREATSVVVDTEALEHPQARAEALFVAGDLQGRLNDPKAEATLWKAIDAAGTAVPTVSAGAWSRLVDVVGLHATTTERGLEIADIALAEVQRAGEPLLLADLLLNRASVLAVAGRHDEAIEAAQQAVEMRERLLPGDDPSLSHALHTLGNALCRAGRLEEGLSQQRRALAILEPALGARHPKVAMNLYNVGATLRALGRPAEAVDYVERSLSISRDALGREHPRVARTLSLIAGIENDQGRVDAALASQRQASQIFEQTLGAADFETGLARHRLGLLLREHGDLEAAVETAQQARAIMESAVGPEDPRLAEMWAEQARLALAFGQSSQARVAVHRAVALTVHGLGPDHPNLRGLQSLAREIEQAS